jgi:hypothetical protein
VNVGLEGFKLGTIDTRHAAAIWMPRCDPDGKPVLAQAPNDASAEKPCSAENRDSAFLHDQPNAMAKRAFLEVPELA